MLSACFHGHCCGLTRVRYSGGIPRVDLHSGWLSSLLFQGRSRLWSERKGKIEAFFTLLDALLARSFGGQVTPLLKCLQQSGGSLLSGSYVL